MKVLLNYLIILFLFASCSTVLQKSENTTFKLEKIIELINNKDTLALQIVINKSNANLQDAGGVNLLTHGVMTEDFNIVKILLSNNADPNFKNKTSMGSTPLMMASQYESLEIAEYLLKNGADIDIQDNNGDPAIHWSAYSGNVPFTKLMLDKGAKTNLKSIHSDGVMQVALKEYQDSIVDLLLENNISIFDVLDNIIPLVNAVKQNDSVLFKNLVDESNINSKDGAGNTLLMIAAEKGYFSIVKYLVENAADINEMNSVGQTALNKSIYFGKDETAKYLIDKGADINKTDSRFILLPLVAAIRSNNLELGNLLLEKGAEINTPDGINNFSPIMWAALYNNKDFIAMLLKHNPDLTIISKYKTNVFDMSQDEEILKMLKKRDN
ncbi:MAG: ankyrin repeat domain-containing protein [Ignavibacteriaceae bacterium]|nr:ankyrin repeat domain-containing protein [Ignavibacteriaceae bacterium]